MCAKFIVLDGKQVVLDRATRTLRDAFELTNTPYRDGLLVGVIKGRKTQKLDVIKEYAVYTNKGEIRIEVDEPSRRLWLRTYEIFVGTKVHWSQPQIVSAGPFRATLRSIAVNENTSAGILHTALAGLIRQIRTFRL